MQLQFAIEALRGQDGSWDELESDWSDQAGRSGNRAEAGANGSFRLLRDLASEPQPAGGTRGAVAVSGFRSITDRRFYAACMLNAAELSGHPGLSLRVRHLVESPLLASGVLGPAFYADVLISTLGLISMVARRDLQARHVRIHFGHPPDRLVVGACRKALERIAPDASIKMRGAWLYLTRH